MHSLQNEIIRIIKFCVIEISLMKATKYCKRRLIVPISSNSGRASWLLVPGSQTCTHEYHVYVVYTPKMKNDMMISIARNKSVYILIRLAIAHTRRQLLEEIVSGSREWISPYRRMVNGPTSNFRDNLKRPPTSNQLPQITSKPVTRPSDTFNKSQRLLIRVNLPEFGGNSTFRTSTVRETISHDASENRVSKIREYVTLPEGTLLPPLMLDRSK